MGAESVQPSALDGRFNVALIDHVQRLVKAPIRENVPGADLSTFAIGGAVRALVAIESVAELSAVLALLASEGQEYRVIGNGSNVLFGDGPLHVWMLKLGGAFRSTTNRADGVIEVGGSTPLMSFARRVCDDGLSGLEFAAGIPATIGGALFMNAGAHGAEIGERVVEVRGIVAGGEEVVWKGSDLPWRYRNSGIPGGAVITSTVLKLSRGDPKLISSACMHNLSERRARQPLTQPSAGSVFKNPSTAMPAGRLLEELGMKGFAVGGALVSELHANWIVNPNRTASARDVLTVIEECRTRARRESGIDLEPEVRLWGAG